MVTGLYSGSGAQPTLQAGNAPVAPLVLHGVVGGGDHLPLDDPHARLPGLFHEKKDRILTAGSTILRFGLIEILLKI